MGQCRWENEFVQRSDPRGAGPYYWLVGESRNLEPEAEDTDRWALSHGYISIVPTTLDCTAYGLLEPLQKVL